MRMWQSFRCEKYGYNSSSSIYSSGNWGSEGLSDLPWSEQEGRPQGGLVPPSLVSEPSYSTDGFLLLPAQLCFPDSPAQSMTPHQTFETYNKIRKQTCAAFLIFWFSSCIPVRKNDGGGVAIWKPCSGLQRGSCPFCSAVRHSKEYLGSNSLSSPRPWRSTEGPLPLPGGEGASVHSSVGRAGKLSTLPSSPGAGCWMFTLC